MRRTPYTPTRAEVLAIADGNDTLGLTELAQLFHVTYQTFYMRVYNNRVPFRLEQHGPGGAYFARVADLLDFVQSAAASSPLATATVAELEGRVGRLAGDAALLLQIGQDLPTDERAALRDVATAITKRRESLQAALADARRSETNA